MNEQLKKNLLSLASELDFSAFKIALSAIDLKSCHPWEAAFVRNLANAETITAVFAAFLQFAPKDADEFATFNLSTLAKESTNVRQALAD